MCLEYISCHYSYEFAHLHRYLKFGCVGLDGEQSLENTFYPWCVPSLHLCCAISVLSAVVSRDSVEGQSLENTLYTRRSPPDWYVPSSWCFLCYPISVGNDPLLLLGGTLSRDSHLRILCAPRVRLLVTHVRALWLLVVVLLLWVGESRPEHSHWEYTVHPPLAPPSPHRGEVRWGFRGPIALLKMLML